VAKLPLVSYGDVLERPERVGDLDLHFSMKVDKCCYAVLIQLDMKLSSD